MRKFAIRRFAAAIVIAAFGLGALAQACNVPVFRFALEHWRPDPYRVVLFHQGKLNESERELLRSLEDQQDQTTANLKIAAVDLADESDQSETIMADRALYEAMRKPQLPWLVVQYPEYLRIPKPAWAGPLSSEVVKAALDSPIRKELARRLADGQTAVWLVLESGDAAKDDAAVALVEEQIQQLEKSLQLPELTDSPADALATTLPLEVKFSMIRVPRNVPAEHTLVAMLIGSEPDLAERTDPMVFPVFGRGRALLPLIGAGITAQNIRDAAGFLAGPCSCEVKEQNPGFDLMLAADWESMLAQNGVALATIETRRPAPAEPVLVPIPKGAQPAAVLTTPPVTASQALQKSNIDTIANTRNLIIGGSILAGFLLAITIVYVVTQSRRVTD